MINKNFRVYSRLLLRKLARLKNHFFFGVSAPFDVFGVER